MQLGSCWLIRNFPHRGISLSVIPATVPVFMSGILVCTVPKGGVISGLLHQGMRARLSQKMWQLVAQAVPAELPGLCHHEAKLWH